jgi:hypothetical protein
LPPRPLPATSGHFFPIPSDSAEPIPPWLSEKLMSEFLKNPYFCIKQTALKDAK